jgi:ABC-type sugar transport system ATPase subunit
VLVLDEPTQGVDVAGRAELHARVRALARGGTAVLLVSSDLEELLALADRIAVMRRGRLVGTLAGEQRTGERVLALALGAGARP